MDLFIAVKKLIGSILICFFVLHPLSAVFAQQAPLHVEGSNLVYSNNSRFVVKGVNLEFYRDSGCSFITQGQWPVRTQIVQKMKSLGINAVRFNYYSQYLNANANNLTQFIDFMQLFAQNDIYVMPSDHSFTGRDLLNYSTTSYPLFKKIVDGVRAKGFENHLIMNPYNEPYGEGNNNNWTHWVTTNKDTLSHLRNTLNFKGVVVLDTRSWAAAFDAASLQQVMTYDATLLGGKSNVVFSNHWYPNIAISNVNSTINSSNTIPLVIGELGQINPGSTGVVAQYFKDVASAVVNTGIPRGHNGIFPWMWSWCDENNMTEDDFVTLNTFGKLVNTEYYAKLPTSPTSIVTPTVILSPTPTSKPGDANNDRKVDGLDYVIWVNNYGRTASGGVTIGDFNKNGTVDGVDYVLWLNNYGT